MKEKALAIIGEISCDGISGGIDLRRGDAGHSQARQSPSPARWAYFSGQRHPIPSCEDIPGLKDLQGQAGS
jgi:hypothetical protein